MRKKIKRVECLLYQLFDARKLLNEWSSHDLRCSYYELSDSICYLADMEITICLWEIESIISDLLPKTGGDNFIVNFFRTCHFVPKGSVFDLFDYELKIRFYETNCQEFECLINCFIKVGKEIRRSRPYAFGDSGLYCGYYNNILHIDFPYV